MPFKDTRMQAIPSSSDLKYERDSVVNSLAMKERT